MKTIGEKLDDLLDRQTREHNDTIVISDEPICPKCGRSLAYDNEGDYFYCADCVDFMYTEDGQNMGRLG